MTGKSGWQGFWGHVQKTDYCWLWTGIRTNGYGRFWYRGKMWRAHRLSWVIHHGKIPKGLLVRHTCDNPPCVNPSHLRLGTALDNTTDAVLKGRIAVKPRKHLRIPLRLPHGGPRPGSGRPRQYFSDRSATGAELAREYRQRKRDKNLDVIFLEDSP